MNAYLAKCKERRGDSPESWRGGNWAPDAFGDDEKVSQRVRDKADQLRAVIGDMKTPGAVHLVAKALSHAYEHAGSLATAIVRESGDYEAMLPDWQEYLAEAQEEAVSEAREEWEEETGSAVETVRGQVAAVEQHMRDLKVHGSITSLIFGAARDAASQEEYRAALALA
jgi:gas vesicle protein